MLTGSVPRLRDVRVGPDGLVYLLTDLASGAILRLEPGALNSAVSARSPVGGAGAVERMAEDSGSCSISSRNAPWYACGASLCSRLWLPPGTSTQRTPGGAASRNRRPTSIGTVRSRSPCSIHTGASTEPMRDLASKRSVVSAAPTRPQKPAVAATSGMLVNVDSSASGPVVRCRGEAGWRG